MEGRFDYTISLRPSLCPFEALSVLFACAITARAILGRGPVLFGCHFRLPLLAGFGTRLFLQFFRRVHTPSASLAAAVAGRIVVAVIKPIVVGKLFAGRDVTDAEDED